MVQADKVTDERLIRCGAKMVPHAFKKKDGASTPRTCLPSKWSGMPSKWSGMPSNYGTWETMFAIVDVFPSATAWGKVVSSGGGIVTTQALPQEIKTTNCRLTRQQIREAHLQVRQPHSSVVQGIDRSR
jgi:hypothetical protein